MAKCIATSPGLCFDDPPCENRVEVCPDELFVGLLHVGDEAPPLLVVHYCHETTRLIDNVVFCLIFLWSAAAFHRSFLSQNEILMVPLRIARDIIPCNTNFVA